MFTKLDEIEKRYKKLERLLATEEVARDSQRLRRMAKEHGFLGKIVSFYDEYKKVVKEI